MKKREGGYPSKTCLVFLSVRTKVVFFLNLSSRPSEGEREGVRKKIGVSPQEANLPCCAIAVLL